VTPKPGFKVTVYLQVEYLKIRTEFLSNTNRKSYTIYRMVPYSMTLSDLWPGFQGHDIFEVEYQKTARLKDKVFYCKRGSFT